MPKLVHAFCIILFAFFISSISATGQPSVTSIHKNKTKPVTGHSTSKHQFKYIIFNNELKGFGYDILDHSKKLIHQPSIPGLRGNKGFTTRGDAAKVAKLAIKKLKNNITPPTIIKQELDSLQINLNL